MISISSHIPASKVEQIHAHYMQLFQTCHECAVEIPTVYTQWATFWSLLEAKIGTQVAELKSNHFLTYNIQKELAKDLIRSCPDKMSLIQDEYEVAFEKIKSLSHPRTDYISAVLAIAINPEVGQSALRVPKDAIGYFLVWKEARNMIAHKSSAANATFFQSLLPIHKKQMHSINSY